MGVRDEITGRIKLLSQHGPAHPGSAALPRGGAPRVGRRPLAGFVESSSIAAAWRDGDVFRLAELGPRAGHASRDAWPCARNALRFSPRDVRCRNSSLVRRSGHLPDLIGAVRPDFSGPPSTASSHACVPLRTAGAAPSHPVPESRRRAAARARPDNKRPLDRQTPPASRHERRQPASLRRW
ncbi:hypothetical protein PVAP13_2NG592520 [Panicum virgatum]|uniref:Uncharacterized protein n=1 Tax=Panicum virgatum TaxID=38727 RepID=A0A8T0VVB5_PANVG|nr:hypothetical protein PVAP13_2NG592520 [Panicum virgatum]